MKDAIVIGCGIIGATVFKALENAGLDVLALDDGRPMSGTRPSGGHLRTSWFGSMSKSQYVPAMDLLDKLWGLKREEFLVYPRHTLATVYRVDIDGVIAVPKLVSRVRTIEKLDNYPIVIHDNGEERCRLLVVATGVWATELLPGLTVTPKQGVSFRIRGTLEQPIIKPWAPYKQVVAHQQGVDEIWVGDGSAILPENWSQSRTSECLIRCRRALDLTANQAPLRKTLSGLRPYCKSGNDPCLLERIGPRAWVATGAGKLGTIAAGWVAGRILDVLPS